MRQFTLACLLLLFAASCKKDAVTFTLNTTYYKYKITPVGAMRVFANSGEVTNNAIINNFLARDSDGYRYSTEYLVTNPGFLDSIRFKDAAKASVVNYTGADYNVSNQDGQLVLTAVSPQNGATYGETFSHSFIYYARQNKPAINDEYLISSVAGFYQFGYSINQKYIFIKGGDAKIAAPVVMFDQHLARGSDERLYFNDKLQPGFNKQIPAGDTVSLREYQLIFNN